MKPDESEWDVISFKGPFVTLVRIVLLLQREIGLTGIVDERLLLRLQFGFWM